ncbi:MAG: bifunctional DNA-formamidopyrimidine glycosylase/DNA-(apurinic or apyrimidinic site) lyase [Betaproteobacteria bacterium]|nr:bifunctional DNA-formamidopyrimidine glycosylase/DNA-(apurinic or apyrimidinic site) lyase [Betaproteobacteria bacterium]
MPELPEVEVSRLGLLPYLPGQHLNRLVLRTPRLRHDIPSHLPERLAGLTLDGVARRGKYLLFDFRSSAGGGWLILHLGMSGSLRLVPPGTPPGKHDHVDMEFPGWVLRLRDPRRFGTLVWVEGPTAEQHPLLAKLGIEPLGPDFDGPWLYQATRRRQAPIKQVLMDAHTIVGVGNIYAAESLFRSRISPLTPAARLGPERCRRLARCVREVLAEAIAAGGSSVRDYVHSDGGAGSFQLQCAVYGRAGEPCLTCEKPIKAIRQGGRSTFYCPHCQH